MLCHFWAFNHQSANLAFLGSGGGNVLNVQRTIKQFIAAGAKGCTLEDQKWPKKSGSVRGKEVIGMDEHIAKVSYHTNMFISVGRHCSLLARKAVPEDTASSGYSRLQVM